jgi:hypothetical protein
LRNYIKEHYKIGFAALSARFLLIYGLKRAGAGGMSERWLGFVV